MIRGRAQAGIAVEKDWLYGMLFAEPEAETPFFAGFSKNF
jgi:hypothetical protein